MNVSKEIWRVRTLRKAAMKEKELVQQAEQAKLQQFQIPFAKGLLSFVAILRSP
jgi:hypothetical protein